ncbi:Uncharacterized protein dnl_17090 [Desulfonema limicola]|uniref:Uncharacterized protein n=1 Tax=Desulfonema limicola TaxID=45656 RepID=A0A975GFR1_9BACT|nr:Uncharacterized protein dnl_17090 [Desulfonema limicola]
MISGITDFHLKKICQRILGFTIDGRAGLHIYFLILLILLKPNSGKMTFYRFINN